jgi:hypothetical protein
VSKFIAAMIMTVCLTSFSETARAEDADGYTLWRRQTLDICQRLPTLAEVECIQANDGQMP